MTWFHNSKQGIIQILHIAQVIWHEQCYSITRLKISNLYIRPSKHHNKYHC